MRMTATILLTIAISAGAATPVLSAGLTADAAAWIANAAPTPNVIPGPGADRVTSRTTGVVRGWRVNGAYEWVAGRWELAGYTMVPVANTSTIAVASKRVEQRSSDNVGTTTEPDVPHDPARPTTPGYPGQVLSSEFTVSQWSYVIQYTYGVNEFGVLGWHMTSVTAKFNGRIRPPVATQ